MRYEVIYYWMSKKLFGGCGAVYGKVVGDGIILLDDIGDWRREMGIVSDCKVIGYWSDRMKAKEWLEEHLGRKVDMIGYVDDEEVIE